MKECAKCHKKKAQKEFYANRTKPDGLQNICIPCRKELDALRVQNGSNRLRHQQVLAKLSPEEREQVVQERREVRRLDRQMYPEKYRQYREQRATIFRMRGKNHYQRNKPQYTMRAKNRRARERNAPGILTLVGVEARFALYGYRCAYCHTPASLTIDHVKPLILGGSNWPANIAPACKPCNSRKQHRFMFPKLPYFPKLP